MIGSLMYMARRLGWNIGVAVAAPWLEAAVWGVLLFPGTRYNVGEQALGMAPWTVYGAATPSILLLTLILAAGAAVSTRLPSRTVVLGVIGGGTTAVIIGYHMWFLWRGHFPSEIEDYGLRMISAIVVGGVVTGAFAGSLVRFGHGPYGEPTSTAAG